MAAAARVQARIDAWRAKKAGKGSAAAELEPSRGSEQQAGQVSTAVAAGAVAAAAAAAASAAVSPIQVPRPAASVAPNGGRPKLMPAQALQLQQLSERPQQQQQEQQEDAAPAAQAFAGISPTATAAGLPGGSRDADSCGASEIDDMPLAKRQRLLQRSQQAQQLRKLEQQEEGKGARSSGSRGQQPALREQQPLGQQVVAELPQPLQEADPAAAAPPLAEEAGPSPPQPDMLRQAAAADTLERGQPSARAALRERSPDVIDMTADEGASPAAAAAARLPSPEVVIESVRLPPRGAPVATVSRMAAGGGAGESRVGSGGGRAAPQEPPQDPAAARQFKHSFAQPSPGKLAGAVALGSGCCLAALCLRPEGARIWGQTVLSPSV